MPAQTFQHYAIDTTSLACTLAIKEAAASGGERSGSAAWRVAGSGT